MAQKIITLRGSAKDLTNQRFGMLVAIAPIGRINTFIQWLCDCDCGRTTKVASGSLIGGKTKSCGRHSKGNLRHGLCKTTEYNVWNGMRQRCNNPNSPCYSRYGGRGIKVCDRWLTFENFYSDMGKRPDGTSLDRIDNSGPYSPENCRWATQRQQCNNTCRNVIIHFDGKKMSVSQWERHLGLNAGTLKKRLYSGWPIEKALTRELMKNQFG